MRFFFVLIFLLPAIQSLRLKKIQDDTGLGLECRLPASEYKTILTVSALKIFRFRVQRPGWSLIADLSDSDSEPRLVADILNAKISGNIGQRNSVSTVDDGNTEADSVLTLYWLSPDNTTDGKYRCEALWVDDDQSFNLERSATVYIQLKEENKPDGLKPVLEDMESRLISNLENRFIEFRNTQAQLLSAFWPEGTYGLHMPATGCPAHIGVTWLMGSRIHHKVSSGVNLDNVSTDNHFGNIFKQTGSDYFIEQRFCVVKTRSVGPLWPKGSYCILRVNTCPEGFQQGWILWNDEKTSPKSSSFGDLPAGDYYPKFTYIYYCCRSDSLPTVPVYLPTEKPFYLYRFNGVCQVVQGMDVKEEFIQFYTDESSKSKSYDKVPDNAIDPDIRITLCYYQR